MGEMHKRSVAAALVLAFLIPACSDDGRGDTKSSKEYSVAASLEQVPASAANDDAALIMSGDLDRASEIAGVERPSGSGRDVVTWLQSITGGTVDGERSDVSIMPLDALRLVNAARLDEIDDELGWSVLDVHTYAGVDDPPGHFAAMTGEFDDDEIDAAQGDREDDIWSLGGKDLSIDPKEISAARPTGGSVRTALHDGLLAESASTPPVRDWLDGDDTLADDDTLLAVAKALDDHDVYSSLITRTAGQSSSGTARTTPATTVDAELAPFDVIGLGSADDDGQAKAILVYHSADEAAAEHNADALRTILEEGSSVVQGRPFSDLYTVDDIDVDGELVVVTLDLADGRSPQAVLQSILAREPFTVSP